MTGEATYKATYDATPIPEPAKVDKTALDKLAKEAASTDDAVISKDGTDVPTDQKWRTQQAADDLAKALDSAQKVLADESATQEQE